MKLNYLANIDQTLLKNKTKWFHNMRINNLSYDKKSILEHYFHILDTYILISLVQIRVIFNCRWISDSWLDLVCLQEWRITRLVVTLRYVKSWLNFKQSIFIRYMYIYVRIPSLCYTYLVLHTYLLHYLTHMTTCLACQHDTEYLLYSPVNGFLVHPFIPL